MYCDDCAATYTWESCPTCNDTIGVRPQIRPNAPPSSIDIENRVVRLVRAYCAQHRPATIFSPRRVVRYVPLREICTPPKHLLSYHEGKSYLRFVHPHGRYTLDPKHNTEYLGIELEAQTPKAALDGLYEDEWHCKISTHAQTILQDARGLYTAERDGSVWPGMELCSMPAVRECWHTPKNAANSAASGELWSATLSILTKLRQLRYTGHDTRNAISCGLHVSVPRDILTPVRLYRLISLVHSNRALFLALSQRKLEDLGRWADIPGLDPGQQKAIAGKKGQFPSRYVWLNLSRTRAEFRLFRSNIRPERVAKNLQVVTSLLDYSKTAPIQYCHEGAAYLEYVQSNAAQYPQLAEYIQEIAPRIARAETRRQTPLVNIGTYRLDPHDPDAADEY